MLARAILAALLGSLALTAPAAATTFAPNTYADTLSAVDSLCSLREAVIAANTDTANGACPAGDGADTIVLGQGNYELTRLDSNPNVETPQDDDLEISRDLTIRGQGATRTTISALAGDRAMSILPPNLPSQLDVTIEDLRITGGRAPAGTDPADQGQAGGAIAVDNANVTLSGCRIDDNRSGNGAAGDAADRTGGPGGAGGAVYATGNRDLVIDSCIFADNRTGAGGSGAPPAGAGFAGGGGLGGDGGALAASPRSLTIRNSTFTGNSTGVGGLGAGAGPAPADPTDFNGGSGGHGGDGGAVAGSGVFPSTITNTVFSANSTGDGGGGGVPALGSGRGGSGGPGGSGGGMYLPGEADLTRVRFAGNRTGDGGAGGPGFASNSNSTAGVGGAGGAFVGLTGELTIVDSTVSGNSSGDGADAGSRAGAGIGGDGGGLYVGSPTLSIERSTISGNSSGQGGAGTDDAFSAAGGAGGGIFRATGDTVLTNVTISGNRTGAGGDTTFGGGTGSLGGRGAGFYKFSAGSISGRHVTIAGNQPGPSGANTGNPPRAAAPGRGGAVALVETNAAPPTASFVSSIIAGNGQFACQGAISARDADTIAWDPVNPNCPGADVNPQLGPLGNNGGPTLTHALPATSPASNRGRAAGCPAVDQRSVRRPQGGGCDAGAFERVVPAPKPPSPPLRDTTPPSIAFALRRQKLRRALSRGYRANFTSGELGAARVDVLQGRKRIGRKSKRLARVGANSVVVKFSRKVRRRYAKRRRLKVVVRLTVTDAAGNRSVARRRVTLRR